VADYGAGVPCPSMSPTGADLSDLRRRAGPAWAPLAAVLRAADAVRAGLRAGLIPPDLSQTVRVPESGPGGVIFASPPRRN
jgi:hypothetical protein